MDQAEKIQLAGQKAKGKRPYFFDDPAVERVLAIAMALAGELAVTRERLDTMERLLEKKGILSREDIESYRPDAQATQQRQEWHAEYIARILRIVQQEREALEAGAADRDLEDLAKEASGEETP